MKHIFDMVSEETVFLTSESRLEMIILFLGWLFKS